MYRPVIAPFSANYNDYGAGENVKGVWLHYILEALRLKLIDKETGENRFKDIAVSKDGFGVDDFFESTLKCRLEIKGFEKPVPVSFTMMRKDVIDDLLTKFTIERWCLESQNTKRITFTEISDYVEDFVSQSILTYKDFLDKHRDTIPLSHLKELSYSTVSTLARISYLHAPVTKKNNPIEMLLQGSSDAPLGSLLNPRDTILSQILHCAEGAGDVGDLYALVRDWLKGEFILEMMETCRKSWYPGFHEGSQSVKLEAHCLLHEAVLNCVRKQITERDHKHE